MARFTLIVITLCIFISPCYAMDLSLKDLSDTIEARFPVYDTYVATTGAPYSYVDAHIYNNSGIVHGLTTADVALKSLTLSQFASTNLNQILTRNHSDLQNVLGGGQYHLSLTDYSALVTTSVLLSYATKAYVNGTDESLYLSDATLALNLYNHVYTSGTTVHGLNTGDVMLKSAPTTAAQIVSTLAAGTAPLKLNSDTLITNLNAHKLNGLFSSDFGTTAAVALKAPLDSPSFTGVSSFGDHINMTSGKKIYNTSTSGVTGIGYYNISSFINIYGRENAAYGLLDLCADGTNSDTSSGKIQFNVSVSGSVTTTGMINKSGNWTLGATDLAGSTYKAYINGSGYLNASAWTYSSDRRLKKNIKYIESATDTLMALRPASFEYKETIGKCFGFIAQDVLKVIPGIVTKNAKGFYGMKTTEIIAFLVKGFQEQQKKIDSLEKRIERLEARIK